MRNLNKENADIKTFELAPFLDLIYDKADIIIIFCGQGQFSTIFKYFNDKSNKGTVRQLVWCKTNPSPMNGEYVYLNALENGVQFKKKGTGKLNCKCKKNYFIHPTGSSKYHPTEKNHELLKDIILDNTSENDFILDCCMGSGSTGIVALENNRNFIGIELNEEYFSIAKSRIEGVMNE